MNELSDIVSEEKLQPIHIGRINRIGVWTLYVKEVQRFLKVYTQTLVAPVITTLLFYAIFSLAIGGQGRDLGKVNFLEFLAPGLIMMALVQNAFANTSSSLMISKVQGNIVDMLMPPLSSGELAFAYVMGGVSRGLCVGLIVGLAIMCIAPMNFVHPFYIVFHAVMASLMLSLLGMVGGIVSEKFDHIAAMTNFVVMPLSFLSGTFYRINALPEGLHLIALFNPFFYMIDGFRYGFIDQADGSLSTGIIVLSTVNILLWWGCLWMLRTGYKLKP